MPTESDVEPLLDEQRESAKESGRASVLQRLSLVDDSPRQPKATPMIQIRNLSSEAFLEKMNDEGQKNVPTEDVLWNSMADYRVEAKHVHDMIKTTLVKAQRKKSEMDQKIELIQAILKTHAEGTMTFKDFFGLVLQADIKPFLELRESLWRLQARNFTAVLSEKHKALKKLYQGDLEKADRPAQKIWKADVEKCVKELEVVWANLVDKGGLRFFLRILQSADRATRSEFLAKLVFQVFPIDPNPNKDEDYLGWKALRVLGRPGATLPSQTPLSNANHLIMVAQGDEYKFPIREFDNDDDSDIKGNIFQDQYYDIFERIEDMFYGKGALPSFAYTTIDINPNHLRECPEILMTIATSDEYSGVAESLLIRGILSRAWDDVQVYHYLIMCKESIYAALLLWAASYARSASPHQAPPLALVTVIMAFSGWQCVVSLIGVTSGMCAAIRYSKQEEKLDSSGRDLARADTSGCSKDSFIVAFIRVFFLFACLGACVCFAVAAINTAHEDEDPMSEPALVYCTVFVFVLFPLTLAFWYVFKPRGHRGWMPCALFWIVLACLISGSIYAVNGAYNNIRDTSEAGKLALYYFAGSVAFVVVIALSFLTGAIFSDAEWRAIKRHIFVGNFWTFFEFIMSIYGFALVIGFMYFKWSHIDDMDWFKASHSDILYEHPTWLAMFICCKVQEVIQKSLCIRGIGENVIPAYNAVFDKASTRVILFLVLLWLNSFLTYYAVPVEHCKGWWENVWQMGVTMYRLDMSGDFDLNNLEGLNPEIHSENGTSVIEESTQWKPWHKAVAGMYMVFFLFMNVGLLNVYIGVVADLYSKKFKRRNEFLETYRAVFIYKILVSPFYQWGMAEEPGRRAVWLMYTPREDEESERAERELAQSARLLASSLQVTQQRPDSA